MGTTLQEQQQSSLEPEAEFLSLGSMTSQREEVQEADSPTDLREEVPTIALALLRIPHSVPPCLHLPHFRKAISICKQSLSLNKPRGLVPPVDQ